MKYRRVGEIPLQQNEIKFKLNSCLHVCKQAFPQFPGDIPTDFAAKLQITVRQSMTGTNKMQAISHPLATERQLTSPFRIVGEGV